MTQPHIVRRYENSEWETAVGEYSAGGGGGGGGGLTVVRYDFAFDTPNIATGVVVYAGAAGDVLLTTSYFIVHEEWEDDAVSLYPFASLFAEGDTPTAFTNLASGSLTATTAKIASPHVPNDNGTREFLVDTNLMLAVIDMIPVPTRGRAQFVGMFL